MLVTCFVVTAAKIGAIDSRRIDNYYYRTVVTNVIVIDIIIA